MDRDQALDVALGQIERQFGKGAVMRMSDAAQVSIGAVSTGSFSLDLALQYVLNLAERLKRGEIEARHIFGDDDQPESAEPAEGAEPKEDKRADGFLKHVTKLKRYAGEREKLLRAAREVREVGAISPDVIARAQCLHRDADVLQYGQLRKEIRDLERFCNSKMCKAMLRRTTWLRTERREGGT